MKRAILIAAVALAGCAHDPVIRERIVEVKVPVATRPITPAQVPALPNPLPKRSGNLAADADTLLAKVCEWVAYGLRSDPLLKVSSGQAPAEAPRFPVCEGLAK